MLFTLFAFYKGWLTVYFPGWCRSVRKSTVSLRTILKLGLNRTLQVVKVNPSLYQLLWAQRNSPSALYESRIFTSDDWMLNFILFDDVQFRWTKSKMLLIHESGQPNYSLERVIQRQITGQYDSFFKVFFSTNLTVRKLLIFLFFFTLFLILVYIEC